MLNVANVEWHIEGPFDCFFIKVSSSFIVVFQYFVSCRLYRLVRLYIYNLPTREISLFADPRYSTPTAQILTYKYYMFSHNSRHMRTIGVNVKTKKMQRSQIASQNDYM